MLNRIAIALSLGLALGGVSSASAANVHPRHHQARVVHRHIVAPAYAYDRYGPYVGYRAYGYGDPGYGAYGYRAYGPGAYAYGAYSPGAYAYGSAARQSYAEDTLPRGEPTYMAVQDEFLARTNGQ